MKAFLQIISLAVILVLSWQVSSPAQSLSGRPGNGPVTSPGIGFRAESYDPLPARRMAQTRNSPDALIDSATMLWKTRFASGLAPSTDIACAVTGDPYGNSFVAGTSTHRPCGTEIITLRYDSAGRRLWTARFAENSERDNRPVAIAADNKGNVYVAGVVIADDGQSNWVILCYSSTGEQRWIAKYSPPAQSDAAPVAMVTTQAGFLVVTGYSGSDIVTIEYDSVGALRWMAPFQASGGSLGPPGALAVDNTEHVYVTGSSGSGSRSDIVTLKYDRNGNPEWVSVYDGPAHSADAATGIAVDKSGSVFVTGWTSVQSAEHLEFVTIRYDAAGNQQWIARENAGLLNVASVIALDQNGNVIVVGRNDTLPSGSSVVTKYSSQGQVLWKDRSKAEFSTVSLDRDGSIYLGGTLSCKYSSEGTRLWTVACAPPTGAIGAEAFYSDSAGNTSIAGYIDIDPDGYGGYDVAVWRMNAEGRQQWLGTYDGSGSSFERDPVVTCDEEGNLLIAHPSLEGRTFALNTMKISPESSVLWSTRYKGIVDRDGGALNGWPKAIKTDRNGNVFVIATSLGNPYRQDVVTVKYDRSGKELWLARHSAPDQHDSMPIDLQVDTSGNAFVAAQENTGANRIVVSKFNPDGYEAWISTYHDPDNHTVFCRAMTIDNKGSLVIVGSSGRDLLTFKLDRNGSQLWVARYNTGPDQYCGAQAVTTDTEGNVYITGSGDAHTTNESCLTLKYTASGALVWASRFKDPARPYAVGEVIHVDNASNVYVGGNCAGTMMVLKYSLTGMLRWSSKYNIPGDWWTLASGIRSDANGNILIMATGSSELHLLGYSPGGVLKRIVRHSLSGAYAFDRQSNLFVTGTQSSQWWSILITAKFAATELPPSNEPPWTPDNPWLSQNYPNPFQQSTIIVFALSQPRKVSLRVFDLLGRTVATLIDGELDAGDHSIAWEPRGFSSGIYYYRIQTSDFTETKKLILLK